MSKRNRQQGKTPKSSPLASPQNSQAVALSHVVKTMQITTGPIPSADELAKYEALIPGLADRLVCIHEEQVARVGRQVDHRMTLEKAVVFGDGRRSWAGLIIGGIVALGVLVWSYQLVMHGHEVVGGIGAAADLGTLAGVFVYGTNTRRAERQDRLSVLTKDQAQSSSNNIGQMALPNVDEPQ